MPRCYGGIVNLKRRKVAVLAIVNSILDHLQVGRRVDRYGFDFEDFSSVITANTNQNSD